MAQDSRINHYNLWYHGVRDEEHHEYITACGTRHAYNEGCDTFLEEITCEVCKASDFYKEALITIEIAYNGSFSDWCRGQSQKYYPDERRS